MQVQEAGGEEMSDAAVTTMAAYIGNAHAKYRDLFGTEPYGTVKQYAALIELCPQLRKAIRLWDAQRQEKETV